MLAEVVAAIVIPGVLVINKRVRGVAADWVPL